MTRYTKILAVLSAAALLIFSGLASADSITTSVRFVIPSTTSFAIAIPSTNSTFVSSGATDSLLFNSTSTSINGLNATAGGGGIQNSTQAIFRYRNDANQNLNVTLAFGTSPTCSGGTIEVKAANATTGYQDTCVSSTIPNETQCVNITNSAKVVIFNLQWQGGSDTRDLWLWADYNTCAAGTDDTQTLTHTSTSV
jgi:hypothetical protein